MLSLAKTGQGFTIYSLCEYAVTMEFASEISDEVAEKISRFNHFLIRQPFPGFQASVPAYSSLTVLFDPMLVMQAHDLPGADCLEKVSILLRECAQVMGQVHSVEQQRTMTLPVCYGGGYGPDLEEVARLHGLSAAEVIRIHSSVVYRVFMIGFVPGFAYLGGLDDRLETARRLSPRLAVPAGSVGIAGKQTGIYPLETPGGWQIIGRTPLTLFDTTRAEPALLQAGDRVRFKAMDEREFNSYREQDAHTNH